MPREGTDGVLRFNLGASSASSSTFSIEAGGVGSTLALLPHSRWHPGLPCQEACMDRQDQLRSCLQECSAEGQGHVVGQDAGPEAAAAMGLRLD